MAELLSPFAGERSGELAEVLKGRFGSLAQALAAPPSELREVGGQFGNACEMLVAAKTIVEAAQREQLQSVPVDPLNPQLLIYLRSRLCRANEERLLVVFCDAEQRYLVDEEMGWGNDHQVRCDVSRLFKRALTLDSSKILLAHNHPSGDCRPSDDDVNSTRQLALTAQVLGIKVVDHLIVTSDRAYSMRSGGRF
ncbi:JAB domain-containing protein [Pontixanthobacter luteolus]|uniref:JAB domain-containing protein n=1 Tax=Pontixanthobacter luteolus TaxID=295089 RepID=UPI00136C2B03|nr:JAB domain-containing protein [Pontixanthobacter luteolus]